MVQIMNFVVNEIFCYAVISLFSLDILNITWVKFTSDVVGGTTWGANRELN